MAEIPAQAKPIQIEETDFRSPTSESLLQKIGGSLNFIIRNKAGLAIGSIEASDLTEAQYQAIRGVGYVVADGRNVSGSAYHALTGNATIPDLRDRFLRCKDYGAGNNSDGDTAIGTDQADNIKAHNHTPNLNCTRPFVALWDPNVICREVQPTDPFARDPRVEPSPIQYANLNVSVGNQGNTGGGIPKSVKINWFIRIN